MTTPRPNLRSGSAPYERTTNNTQRRLVATYDRWSLETRRGLLAIADRGGGPSAFVVALRNRIPLLEAELQERLREGTAAAANVGVGRSLARSPSAQALIRNLNQTNFALVQTSLIPTILDGLTIAFTTATVEFDAQFFANSFAVYRSRIAQFAGGSWVAIFEIQRQVAIDTEDPRPVRWNLTDQAEHCSRTPTHHGCPDLARTYDRWSDLITVPAGQVTCRGNCRCYLTVFTNGEWVRGLS